MRALAFSLMLLPACGYSLVQPGARPVRLAAIEDLSAEGDLGVAVQRRVRAAVDARDDADAVLEGTVRAEADRAAGFDATGVAALYEQPVVVTLRLIEGGRVVWTSGPRRRTAVFPRGATPTETDAARRAALARAARDATDDALSLMESPR